MTRVFSVGSQLPGTFLFACPKCGNMFNIVCEEPGKEIAFCCPRCKEELELVTAMDPRLDTALRTDLIRAKPIGKSGSSGMPTYFYKCPHCGNNEMVMDQSMALGMEEEEDYVAQCIKCGKEYIRET